MNRINSILCIALLVLSACKTDPLTKAKNTMGVWFDKKINLPEQVEFLNADLVAQHNLVDYHNLSSKDTFYVIHYFDAGCDKCVGDLKNAQAKIKSIYEGKPVKFLFIADAPNNYFAKKAIDSVHFQYPVYYEKQPNRLHLKNHFPIGDPLYNTFLMDNKSHLILFGAVFDNKPAEQFYQELITKN